MRPWDGLGRLGLLQILALIVVMTVGVVGLLGPQKLVAIFKSRINNGHCPNGYVQAPFTEGQDPDFCAMKYEAKVLLTDSGQIHRWGCDNDFDPTTGTVLCNEVAPNWVSSLGIKAAPVSVAEGRPWRKIDRDQVIRTCRGLNSEANDEAIDRDANNDGTYDLLSLRQWQVIARDIESVEINWRPASDSMDYVHELNHGHADGLPGEPLPASTNDQDGCVGTGQALKPGFNDSCPGGWDLEKRTHNLSNGEVIWDMSGNVWEWVKAEYKVNFGPDAFWATITDESHPAVNVLNSHGEITTLKPKDLFGPLGDYPPTKSYNYYGLGFAYLNYSEGAVLRGGSWPSGQRSGVFYVSLGFPPSSAIFSFGFRCAYIKAR